MNIEHLKSLLEDQLDPDILEQTYTGFLADTESPPGISDFLEHLKSKALIPHDIDFSLNDLDSTEVEFDTIDTFFDETSLGSTFFGDTTFEETQLPDQRIQGQLASHQMPEELMNGESYILLDILGEGAMGRVHLAKDRFLRRKVAFKELLPLASEPEREDRFLSEAQITSQLAHPHVVPIYALEKGVKRDVAYSMKMVKGHTLKDKIKHAQKRLKKKKGVGSFGLFQRLEAFVKICHALELSHHKGIIHRDLKPANIMLGDYNEIYVMDWGIARPFLSDAVDERVEITLKQDIYAMESGQIIGTPRYMSPEQAGGLNDRLDQRSDIFSMGLILFELANLKQAIQGRTTVDVLSKVIRGDFEDFEPGIPPELKSIIFKATQRRRVDRYQKIEDLVQDLEFFLQGLDVEAHQYTLTQNILRFVSAHRSKFMLAVMLIVSLGLGATAFTLYEQQVNMERAKVRKDKISHLLSEVANQAQSIDNQFLSFQGLVESLFKSSEVVLNQSQESDIPVYFYPDFQKNANSLMRWAEPYQQKLSFDSVVFKLAPGTVYTPELKHLTKRLTPMKHTFKQLFLTSRSEQLFGLPTKKANDVLYNQKGPIIWSFIGFESGIHMAYPGKGNYPLSFDPRKRPWYRSTRLDKDFTWGAPYPDSQHQTLVIPCTRPIFSKNGKLFGVAGIDVSLSFLKDTFIQKFKSANSHPFVMTAKGQFITEANVTPKLKEALKTQVLTHHSGYLEVGGSIYAYAKLDTLGWFYIVETDLKQLLKK